MQPIQTPAPAGALDLSAGMQPTSAAPAAALLNAKAALAPKPPAPSSMQQETGLTSGPSPLGVYSNASQWFKQEAQRQANLGYGPEAAQGVRGAPSRIMHAALSPVADVAAMGYGMLGGAGDPKTAAATLALTNPATAPLGLAAFATQGTGGMTGLSGEGSSIKRAYQNPTPENIQQALSEASMVAGAAHGAGAPVEAGVRPETPGFTAVQDLNKALKAGAQRGADYLRQSGAESMGRVLGPTTKANKAITQKVAPELAERGVTAFTRKGLAERASGEAEAAGQKIDDFYSNLPEGKTIPTQPILDHFEQSKNAFKGSNGEVLDQAAIDRVDELKKVVQQFGPDVSVDDIVKLRRLWDDQVSASNGFYGKTVAEGSALEAKRAAADSIRKILADQFPDLDTLNKEFSFWANVRRVIGDTVARKTGQAATPLGEKVMSGLGFLKGGPKGAALMAFSKVVHSTAWGTVSAATKFKIANLLADGDVAGATQAASQATGGAGPANLPPSVVNPPTPPQAAAAAAGASTVPPWTNAGQGNLNFNQPTPAAAPPVEAPPAAPPMGQGNLQFSTVPSETSGFPEAKVTQPVAPPFAGAGQPKPQTPASAETTAPAAPETPQTAPPAETVTPEQRSRQKAAVEQAKQDAVAGRTDPRLHEKNRQAAYLPELEPPEMRGVMDDRDLDKDANGQYNAEATARHERQFAQAGIDARKGVPEDQQPVAHILAGGAATGKTRAELVRSQAELPDAPVINPDDFMEGNKERGIEADPRYTLMKDSDPLGAAHRAHEQSAEVANEAQTRAIENRQNVIIDRVSGNSEKLAEDIKHLKAAGYRVELRGVDRDLGESLQAMAGRFDETGRWVPAHVLEAGHKGAAKAIQENATNADRTTLRIAPKGGGAHVLVSEHNNGEPGVVYNESAYQDHRTKGGLNDTGGAPETSQASAGRGAGGLSPDTERPQQVAGQQYAGGQGGAGETQTGGVREARPAPGKVTSEAPPSSDHLVLGFGRFNPPHAGHVTLFDKMQNLAEETGADAKLSINPKQTPQMSEPKPAEAPGSGYRWARAKDPLSPQQKVKYIQQMAPGLEAVVHPAGEMPNPEDVIRHYSDMGYKHLTLVEGPEREAGFNEIMNRLQNSGQTHFDSWKFEKSVEQRSETASATHQRKAVLANDFEEFQKGLPKDFSPDAAREMFDDVRKGMGIKDEPPAPPASSGGEPNQGTRLAGHDGNETSVRTPTGNQLKGKYRVVEGDTLTPSHDPLTFAKNPNYPQGVQERAYHSSKEAQMRVIDQEQKYDPAFTLSDDPTGQNGPAITTPDGTVLGGNSRVMTSQRLYAHGNGDIYKNALIDKAAQFGLDPEQIRGMQKPTLVREIDAPQSADELRRIGSDLNKPMSGALGASEKAVSAGKSLRPESLEQIGRMIDQQGEGGTLRQVLSGRGGKDVLDILQRDGLITDRERPGIVDTGTGGLSEEGKNFVEKALLGSIVDDPDLMDKAPRSLLNKLGSSIGELSSLNARSDDYNISPLIRAALREHVSAAQRGGPFTDYISQKAMFGERSKAVETVASALNGPVKNLRQSIQSFARDARADVQGQSTLGLLAEKPSAVGAFNHAFGTNLSEVEFETALRRAQESEGQPPPKGKAAGPMGLPRSITNPVK
jgi:hypothetical protein